MKREAKELNNLIEQVSQKVVDKVVNEKYLVSRMAVIVNEFDPNTNSASIIIPTDLSNHTDYKYPNRTGMTSLRSTVWENGQIKTYGDKVYLVYQSNNISQGWLESNKSLDIVKEVSRDYLTKVEAANTYETKTDANNKYVKKTGDTMTGALNVNSYIQTNGSGANSRIVAQDSVHNGQVRLQFVNNHTQHGIYSTGYSADGTTWTSDGRWIICRESDGRVRINNRVRVDANGNIRAEGYVSLGGNVYADGGDIHAGTTTKARTANNGVHSVAGKIYLHTEGTTSGKRGLWVSNRSDTYKEIISVDQNNNVSIPTDITVKTNITSSTNVNASLANNNVSSTTYPTTMNIVDNANRIIARTEGVVNPNGNIGMYMYVRNYNTSGAQVAQKGLRFHMNKSGNLTWSVSDPANFVAAIKSSIVDAIYPVGAIYISTSSTSPATLFGGTWEQIKGRFLLSTGAPDNNSNTGWGTNLTWDGTNKYNEAAGSTGGESLHTLSIAEMPSHKHATTAQLQWVDRTGNVQSAANNSYWTYQGKDTLETGGGGAHNNMPPYLVVYMWKRTA